VALISPFVRRILDWYLRSTGRGEYPPEEDPGVASLTKIYNYLKKHGHRTELMGASFRNVGELLELAGWDLLTIAPPSSSPSWPATAASWSASWTRAPQAMDIDKLHVDEKTFRELHEQDRIAHEKLAEGIDGLSKTQASLKALLMEKMKGDSSNAARDLFSVFDLDGDGFITREEWGAATRSSTRSTSTATAASLPKKWARASARPFGCPRPTEPCGSMISKRRPAPWLSH
jgi:transaldolase